MIETTSFAKQIIYILRPMWKRIFLVLVFSLISSGLSLLSVGVMAPYVKLIEKPATAFRDNVVFVDFLKIFSLDTPEKALIGVSFSLMLIFVLKNAAYFVVQYVINYTNMHVIRKLKYRLFRAYMYAPYSFHQSKNTMQLINTATNDISSFSSNVVQNILVLISDGLLFIMTFILLSFVTPQLILAGIFLLLLMLLFHRFSRTKTFRYGKIGTETNAASLKLMNQGFQGIASIKLFGAEDFFVKKNDQAIHENVSASAKFFTFLLFPRIAFETIILIGFIAYVLFSLFSGKSSSEIFASAGTIGLASITLIPSMSRITNAVSAIKGGQAQTNNVFGHLKEIETFVFDQTEINASDSICSFNSNIVIQNLTFKYPERIDPALNGISLTIQKGSSVGFIGKTGSGKSTLVSLIMGLYSPDSGKILIDNIDMRNVRKAWQHSIGYVPQHIYLLDDTLRNNIAFGIDPSKISETALQKAVELSSLKDVIALLPDGLNTNIGENGFRLSGGQRQRIGIARALYREPSVLVFDEATSALDSTTEDEISESLKHLNRTRTIFMIAHRISTLRYCDIIFELEQGRISRSGSYDCLFTTKK